MEFIDAIAELMGRGFFAAVRKLTGNRHEPMQGTFVVVGYVPIDRLGPGGDHCFVEHDMSRFAGVAAWFKNFSMKQAGRSALNAAGEALATTKFLGLGVLLESRELGGWMDPDFIDGIATTRRIASGTACRRIRT